MRGMKNTAHAELKAEINALRAVLSERDSAITKHKRVIAQQAQVIAERDKRIVILLEQIRLQRHKLYGASSEQASGQGQLFDEADVLAASATDTEPPEPAVAGAPDADEPARRRGKRAPLPVHLPRLDIVHDLTDAERRCDCGHEKVVIGEDISEQLDIVPMQVRVLRHVRKTCACPRCQGAPVTAALPPQPIPKSNASASLLALLLTAKYVDGIPLHRFEKVLARHGFDGASRNTLARWVIACSHLLVPLENLLRERLLSHDVLFMDETTVQVLKEPGKTAQSQSYMWVQSGGLPEAPIVLFDYDPSRSGAVPTRLLGDYGGYLMTDGYDGYNAVVAANGITHLACWAHARRKFVEAQKVQPKGKSGSADVALNMIGTLYSVERDLREVTDPVERKRRRDERSAPILCELRTWLDKQLPRVPPKTALGTAVAYLNACWPKLVRYLKRGDLPIDNNRAENAIRPFVIGRKNWLFSDTPAGAQASARIYGLIETAKANGHEPHAWLRHVLAELPKAKSVEDVEALLPWNLDRIALIGEAYKP